MTRLMSLMIATLMFAPVAYSTLMQAAQIV